MIKKILFILFLVIFVLSPVFAQRGGRSQDVIEVRLGSPLPRNSDWGRTLDRIAGEWARVTNNAVRLRVIHDGLEGTDAKMLASLNADNIQAALFTSSGLMEICPPVMSLSVPFMIRNEEEFDLVLADILPVLNSRVLDNYVVVTWSKGGWLYVFSRESVRTPDDLRRQKLSVSPDLKDMNTAFRRMEYTLIESGLTELGPRLASGSVNSTLLMPEAIAPLGIHRYLRNMLDLPIAPFVGAIVVNRVTWNKINPEHQAELIRVTQQIADNFGASIIQTSVNAMNAMQRDGLTIIKPSAAEAELWRNDLIKVIPSLLGTTFDREIYQRINELLERSRNK